MARTLLAQLSEENVTEVAKERKAHTAYKRDHVRRPLEYWSCGRMGHIARCCPTRGQGNERGEQYAPAASRQM